MNDQTMRQPDEQEVRELLHNAGPRQELPEDDLRAIRQAAREAWQKRVADSEPAFSEETDPPPRQQRWQPWLALAASLTLVLLTGWWWSMRPLPPEWVATVEVLQGDVSLQDTDDLALALETQLPAGALLETRGTSSQAGYISLRLAEGSLRLDSDSRVRLLSAGRVELLRGAVYFDSGTPPARDGNANPVEGGIEIETAYGLVRDIGTQFEVRLDAVEAALRVRVREGMALLDVGEEVHIAVDGEELRLRRQGTLERATIDAYGEAWSWVLAAAPVPSIEGLPLIEVLQWLSRESGWQLRYQDPRLEQAAAAIDVYAPVDGLTSEEVLEVVMTGSGLTYRLEPGTLVVDR